MTPPPDEADDPASPDPPELAVGQTAPEIQGEDLNGKRMKLSDFRGKVVLLMFWGSWCKVCMAEVPHEQELLQRWGGQGFAVVGVNSDEDRAAARRACADKGLTWRSFWDRSPEGPVIRRWNVHRWPTLYLIDAAGVIRCKGKYLNSILLRTKGDGTQEQVRCLDQAVESLMNEMAGGKKP
jgi:peroxiredoxin